jgi:nucleoside triphosphate diphosphatase
MKSDAPIFELLRIMARLRSPKGGCPWDLEQNHRTLRFHAVEEVYELLDAIEAEDDHEMAEELGDILLQVIFHSQLAKERGAFDFNDVCRVLAEKLIRRHPHVFGTKKLRDAGMVLAQWERIKRAEKKGTKHERPSALDGIPKHLPGLLRAEKLIKKARKAKIIEAASKSKLNKSVAAKELFELVKAIQGCGWSAEELLRAESKKREREWRRQERKRLASSALT